MTNMNKSVANEVVSHVRQVTYRAKGNAYVYSVINDIPADKSCVGMTIKTLCWGKARIVEYKDAKHISILFLNSGAVAVVQKAALQVGNVADSVAREFNSAKAIDVEIIESCRKQMIKLQEKARKAGRRIKSRDNNRKMRLNKAIEIYNMGEKDGIKEETA